MTGAADFSPCKRYRYRLTRSWDESLPTINFICLNPSTADERNGDPTVTRLIRRSVDLGFGKLIVTNIFAVRGTDPSILKQVDEPIGEEHQNDLAIFKAAKESYLTVAAWGQHGKILERGKAVEEMLRESGVELHVLKLSKDGTPSHPLYLRYDLKPVLWK